MALPTDGWVVLKDGTRLLPLAEWHGKPCPYCENVMLIGTARPPTRDHVVPKRMGGTLSDRNTLIVCRPCNGDKGDKTLEQFANSLTRRADARAAIVWALVERRGSKRLPGGARPPAAVPLQYPDDPKAQAAFEAVYRDRPHMLRIVD